MGHGRAAGLSIVLGLCAMGVAAAENPPAAASVVENQAAQAHAEIIPGYPGQGGPVDYPGLIAPSPKELDWWIKATGSVTVVNGYPLEGTGLFRGNGRLNFGDNVAVDGKTSCEERTHWYGGAEYLLWWIKRSHVPVLVTGGSVDDDLPGALGQPGTSELLGGFLDPEERSGGRFQVGYWLDDHQTLGVDSSFFFLGERSIKFAASSSGAIDSPVLARPFFNTSTGMEDADSIALPGIQAGSVRVDLASELWGADAGAQLTLLSGCCYRVALLGGGRFINLNEILAISEHIVVPPEGPANVGQIFDNFKTRNRFYGGQVGGAAQFVWGRWGLDVQSRVGLGKTEEVVDIRGATILTFADGHKVSFPAGLLGEPTNNGRYLQNQFAVAPDVGVTLAYQCTDNIRATVGYSFLYWSAVVRPGDQIDRSVNPSGVPTAQGIGPLVGPALPAFRFHETDFWAQGISFGLQIMY